MVNLSNEYFLMIEPDQCGEPSESPIEDSLTKKVDFIFSTCINSDYCFKGIHTTKCGKCSDNRDWILPNGMITNNLCTYYIRYYRNYIQNIEIDKINKIYDLIMIDM